MALKRSSPPPRKLKAASEVALEGGRERGEGESASGAVVETERGKGSASMSLTGGDLHAATAAVHAAIKAAAVATSAVTSAIDHEEERASEAQRESRSAPSPDQRGAAGVEISAFA